MDNEQHRGSKAKIIAWCIAIAAVAIVYIASNSRSSTNTGAPRTTGSTTAPSKTQAPTQQTSNSNSTASYKDGTYTADSSYRTPDGSETIEVDVTIASGTVTKATVQQNPTNRDSQEYQSAFQESYQPYVVGKKLSDIKLSRISGSSLTSVGFNQALDQIKTQAQA